MTKKLQLLFIVLINLALFGNPVFADTSMVNVAQKYRLPSAQVIDSIKGNPEFFYREEARGKSLWQMFMDWLSGVFRTTEGSFADNFIKEYFWYLLVFGALAFVIYKLFHSEITGLFYQTKRSKTIKISGLEDDIHEIDFDKMFAEALESKNFRFALRLYYLKSLKLLSDRGLINWEKDKTNRDFLEELSGTGFQDSFERITLIFNRIWYGDFPLDETAFNSALTELRAFNSGLKTSSGR